MTNIAISSSGLAVRRIVATVACLALLSCGATTQPSVVECGSGIVSSSRVASVHVNGAASPIPNYAGAWSGRYRDTACVRTCGSGVNICKYEAPPGQPSQGLGLRLRLSQDGARVSGSIELLDNTAQFLLEQGPIFGVVDDSGALVLSGTTTNVIASEPDSHTVISDWKTTLGADSNTMSGRFTRYASFKNVFGSQQYKYECELMTFQRSQS